VGVLVICAAWLTLLLLGHGATHGAGASGSMHQAMRAPDSPTGLRTVTLGGWLLMTVAMMGPGALGGVEHVSRNSLAWRRGRAALEYAGAYLAAWAVAGIVVLTVVHTMVGLVPGAAGAVALAVVLGAGAAWQLTPWKRSCLRACHRSLPLPPQGWPAERAAVRMGWRNGAACVGSCSWMMLAMAVAPAAQLLLTAVLTVAVTAEKGSRRPRRTTRLVAAGLAVASLMAAAVA
jgi:predicted metal-binding membrane protein